MAESTANSSDAGHRLVEISKSDLPLSCPRPEDELWNMHPRVYLPIEKTGEEICPYCGAHYRLKG